MTRLEPVTFSKARGHEPRLSKPYVPGRRSTRFWSKAEIAVVKAHYESDGVGKCMSLLPGRSAGALQQQANKLGLSRQGKSAKWLPNAPADLDDRIRAAWQKMDGKKRGAVNDLADQLKIPRWWLSKRLVILELALPGKKEPPWTAAELRLMTKVPLHDVARCSKIFREHGFSRTPTAIMVKAKRLDLSRRYNETFSATTLAKIVGFDSKTMTVRCVSGEIKATRRKSQRLAQQGGAPWSITRDDARAFILEHLEQIDLRKVEKFAFVDLLVNRKPPKKPRRA